MKITVTTSNNNHFQITEGTAELVDFKYTTEGKIMEDGEAILHGTKISLRPRTSFWWLLSFITKKADILKNDEVKGEISFGGWQGTTIRLKGDAGFSEKKYYLNSKIISSDRYILKDDLHSTHKCNFLVNNFIGRIKLESFTRSVV